MAFKTYKGKYRLKNPGKYVGDRSNVVYRSGWERACFLWCDRSDLVETWNSEETVIPYVCSTDKRWHNYYIDLRINWKDGSTSLIEIKPDKETRAPKGGRGKTRARLTEEVKTFAKNSSKWKFAEAYCAKRKWRFEIWTEKTLKRKGILKF